FRGAPLADFRFEDFTRREAARIEELRLYAYELKFEAALALGRHDDVIPELEPLISEEPLRERFRAQLMLALYRAGRQAEALDAYQAARSTLIEELGLEPGPQLQRLERDILNPEQAPQAPPGGERAAPPPQRPRPTH